MRRRAWHLVGSVLVVAFAAFAAGCGSDERTTSATSPGTEVRIALGLYSGRPDPTWVLTADQADELKSALARLAPADTGAPLGGLGYHGFTIVSSEGTRVAYAGTVADTSRVLDDPDRTIERLLLETARPHATPEAFAIAEDAIHRDD